jgi:hypothetical protein
MIFISGILFAAGMLLLLRSVIAIVASLIMLCYYLIKLAAYLVVAVLAVLGLVAQWGVRRVSILLRRSRGLPESEAEPCITIEITVSDEEDDIAPTIELPRSGWRRLRGWAKPRDGELPRIIVTPPWSVATDDLLADLRLATAGLSGERLYLQLRANITDRTEPHLLVPERSESEPTPATMIPVTLAAFYLFTYERKVRDLEDVLDEERRRHDD